MPQSGIASGGCIALASDLLRRLLRITSRPLLDPVSGPDIPPGFEHLEEPPLRSIKRIP